MSPTFIIFSYLDSASSSIRTRIRSRSEPRVIRIPGDGTNVRRSQSSSNFRPRFPSGCDCLQAPTIVQRFRALDDRGLLSPVFRQRPRPPTSSHVLDLRSATEAPSGGLRPTSPSFRKVEPSDSRGFRRLRTTRRTEEGRSAELQPLSRAENRLNRAPFFLCFSRERETLCDIPAVETDYTGFYTLTLLLLTLISPYITHHEEPKCSKTYRCSHKSKIYNQ
ncbi:3-oxoacyl-[acyl-carrier-protein] synthase 3 [Striga asiatica]|uniref:3-oxoacyl-[acyl-carrier-protein] synthase 3 n=1 Tax=Striga asiatica TaxID=4170 RepID=A0A5A7RDR7_STRAF|nr:3-oxoacyl-[acyl-carrier-protein] synthase 3 [Striga asiatica]